MFKITKSTTRLNELSCTTLAHNETTRKSQESFLDGVQKRSLDYKFMLHWDFKLNFDVKLGIVACFAYLSARCSLFNIFEKVIDVRRAILVSEIGGLVALSIWQLIANKL